ncbi:MAG: hypothetical protein D6718_08215 [Acidobacteria bacterium]|nr:MAG: hypothetical protein D6718_08215 [Acidobacteriota bacterium]
MRLNRARDPFPIRAAAALAAAALLLPAGGCGKRPEPTPLQKLRHIPRELPVVRIGDAKISASWLFNWCAMQEIQMTASGPFQVDEYSLIDAGRKLLTKMVAIALEAERRGLEVSDAEVEEQLAKEMARYDSTEQWRKQLEAAGLSVDERKEQIRMELLFNKYRDELVAPRVRKEKATRELARKFYDMHRDDLFRVPRRIHLFHLLRSVAKDAPEEEQKREREIIEKARRRIAGGEAFEDVARELSTDPSAIKGGDLGWITRDAPMLPEVRDVVLKLDEGELSEIVRSAHGFHLFLAKEVEPEHVRPFEEVEKDIRERLFKEALKIAMEREAAQLIAQYKPEFLNLEPYIGKPAAAPAPAAAGNAGGPGSEAGEAAEKTPPAPPGG